MKHELGLTWPILFTITTSSHNSVQLPYTCVQEQEGRGKSKLFHEKKGMANEKRNAYTYTFGSWCSMGSLTRVFALRLDASYCD